jgi:Spy/CpxP family protein refolding chaperone
MRKTLNLKKVGRVFVLFSAVVLVCMAGVGTLSAKDPPEAKADASKASKASNALKAFEAFNASKGDAALHLTLEQAWRIQKINDYFERSEKPLRTALERARADYKRALQAKDVDQETVRPNAAAAAVADKAADKAAGLLAIEEALHRANLLVVLTPQQQTMVTAYERTGRIPGEEEEDRSKHHGGQKQGKERWTRQSPDKSGAKVGLGGAFWEAVEGVVEQGSCGDDKPVSGPGYSYIKETSFFFDRIH